MFDRIDSELRLPLDPDSLTPRSKPLHLRPSTCVAVAAGGLLGVLLRFGFGCVFPTSEGHFPWPTYAINVVGAMFLGLLLEVLSRLGDDDGWLRRVRLCVGTGLLGSFTTYSTFALDVDLLLRGRHFATAGIYMAATILTGLLACGIGIGIASGARVQIRRAEKVR